MRAKLVEAEQVGTHRWSSLMALRRTPWQKTVVAATWLQHRGGWPDDIEGIRCYGEFLKELAADERRWEREGLIGLGRGWVIGTRGWMPALAKEHARPGLAVGLPKEEREALQSKPMKQDWKMATPTVTVCVFSP